MELIYVWVKSYACFKRTGFNLNSKHSFDFDYDSATLKYCYGDNNINLYDNLNMHLTAVVGNNGAGKTTFLELLFNNLCDGEGGVKVESLYVFKPHNEEIFQIYFCPSSESEHKSISLKCEPKWQSRFQMEGSYIQNRISQYQIQRLDRSRISIDALSNVHFIYMSNIFDNRYYSYTKAGNISDLSTTARIRNNHQLKIEMDFINPITDLNINYFYTEFSDQIEFITAYSHFENFIPFRLPHNVIMSFANLENRWDSLLKLLDNEEASQKIKRIFSLESTTPTEIFKDIIIEAILVMLLNDYTFEPRRKRAGFYPEIVQAIANISLNDPNECSTWCIVKRLILSIRDSLKASNIPSEIFTQRYITFIEWLDENADRIGDMERIRIDQRIIIPTTASDSYVGIKSFFNEYRKTASIFEYLQFSWGLSTGENTILSLFSRFFTLSKKVSNRDEFILLVDNEKKSNAIILIDEADIALHPEWQQRYIKLITEFLSDIYKETQIQLIIATHSPIILSDIPRQNVIFLRKTDDGIIVDPSAKHAETFAANISTLFYDSFILQRGSIGAFAKAKIDEIIKKMKPKENSETKQWEYPKLDDKQYDSIFKEITIIGEPIIQRKLFDMLNECRYSNADGTRSDEQHAQILKQRLERAQKEYNDYMGGGKL